jgi:ABC-2 type transport system permease protein
MELIDSIRYLIVSQYYGVKSFFIYRLQALISISSAIVSIVTSVLTITVVYSVSTGIPGWDYYHLLFLSLLSGLTIAIISYFNFYNIPKFLREGTYDAYFTKPVGMLSLMLSPLNVVSSPASVVSLAAVLLYVGSVIGLSLKYVVLFAVAYAAGTVSFLMFLTALSVLSYRLVKSGTFINRLTNLLGRVDQYPLPIYGVAMQSVFSLLIPVGIAVYYPAQVFMGSVDAVSYVALLAAALAVAVVSRSVLYRLMKGYTSGGG